MQDSLRERKRLLSREFLGREGIHSVGSRKSTQEIVVYLGGSECESQSLLLDELRNAAKPFGVEVVREEAPRIATTAQGVRSSRRR